MDLFHSEGGEGVKAIVQQLDPHRQDKVCGTACPNVTCKNCDHLIVVMLLVTCSVQMTLGREGGGVKNLSMHVPPVPHFCKVTTNELC